ncbi:transcriptional regulator [Streptomyces humidus]|uniref:Transcriptional regulator n=1 Tax=Streptomyces humidus TaxID=52259 RepID=A0A918FQ37_9ACTN|nr:ROK family transcriptional regulator [Streptomyces humidus]GGR67212.1 transcriptional regulator [Streptomyces humidus]
MNRTDGGVNLLGLRSHNTALVLDLLRTAGPDGISRLELAERTGLTPQAVSKITARLRQEGLAAEAGHRASTGGKPRTVLRLVPEAGHAVGVHLDRDELRVVLAELDGRAVRERCVPLSLGAGAETVLEAVVREVTQVLAGTPSAAAPPAPSAPPAGTADTGRSPVASVAGRSPAALTPDTGRGPAASGSAVARAPVATAPSAAASAPLAVVPALLGVGVALPGPLDHASGVLHRVTGFPEWDGFPLRDVLAERLGAPVVVDKDTNAAALGLAVGGERGSFACLHLGTGLGAGLVIGGTLHRGARTGAGEFGHQVVQLDGPPCSCGNRGCIEALCLAALGRGDVGEAARVLGVGAANLAGLLDIDAVLLGGRAIAAAPEAFLHGVTAVLHARARREGSPEDAVRVRLAPYGARAVAHGAAHLLLAPLFGREAG